MYDFVNFSRDIAGTPFPSVKSKIQPTCLHKDCGEHCTYETSCPAFKGSLLDSPMMRVDGEAQKYGCDGWNTDVFYGRVMCELRHPSISTSWRYHHKLGVEIDERWLHVFFIRG